MKKILIVLMIGVMTVFLLASCRKDPATTPTPTPTQSEATATPTGTGENLITPPTGKDNYIDSYYATSVMFTDPFGRFYEGDENSEILGILLEMTKNAKPSVYLDFSVDASNFYKAEFNGPAGPVVYKFYFSTDPNVCYFKSGGGKYYYSNPEPCEQFLSSEYSEGAYKNARYPEMSVGENVLNPKAVEWEYKKINGEYVRAMARPTLGGGESVGTLSASFVPKFSTQPTTLSAKVTDLDGNSIFEGALADLCYINLSKETAVNITLNAVWDKSADGDCAGNASYAFSATLTPTARFSINKTTATPGEFLVITCENPDIDLSKVEIKSNIKNDTYEVKFFSDGSTLRALLPIPLDVTGTGVTYTVEAYGNTINFFVTLKTRTPVTRKVSRVTEEMLDELMVVSNPYPKIFSQIKDEIYKNTTFARLYSHENYEWGYEETLRANFGDKILYNSDPTKTEYMSYDYSYVGTIYDDLTAVGPGRVVYVGKTEYTAGLVVVDHGMGLLSWYWNLSDTSIKVRVGQEVKTGDVIGRNGGGGLSEVYNGVYTSAHVALTVYDVPVDLGLIIKTAE